MTEIAPLAPGSTIGILGTGQLGRMLCVAASQLGFRTIVFGPEDHPPAAHVAGEHIKAAFEDLDALSDFATQIDAATFEFENIPPLTVRHLTECGITVRPDDQVLTVCQDRLAEKLFLREQGLKTAPFFTIDRLPDLTTALAELSSSAILKSRRFGYDGKGQARIKAGDDPAIAFEQCGGVPCLLEGMVDFACEVSQIAARSVTGEICFFDLPENQHRNGVLAKSIVPANVPALISEQARTLSKKLLEALDYVGVMTVEFFWDESQGLIANEIAPRVHNSGHWTSAACYTDQFEQHIRAVAGWPLGNPTRHSDAEMVNIIGQDADQWLRAAKLPDTSLTLYGKRIARKGRKMGHYVTLSARTPPAKQSSD